MNDDVRNEMSGELGEVDPAVERELQALFDASASAPDDAAMARLVAHPAAVARGDAPAPAGPENRAPQGDVVPGPWRVMRPLLAAMIAAVVGISGWLALRPELPAPGKAADSAVPGAVAAAPAPPGPELSAEQAELEAALTMLGEDPLEGLGLDSELALEAVWDDESGAGDEDDGGALGAAGLGIGGFAGAQLEVDP